MLKKSECGKSALFTVLLVATMISSLLVFPQTTTFSSASPAGTEYLLSVYPRRIQEGLNTNITVGLREASANTTYTLRVNVTAPDGVSYSANVAVVTDGAGSGSNRTEFWNDFAPSANTNQVGVYRITVNETLATANFTVGLTDKVKYIRSETVSIRGTGYNVNETVWVDLKFSNLSVSGFPRQVNASAEGVVAHSWVVPADASLGVYNLTISNATTTVKPVPDVQSFTVEGICEVQTRNLADESMADVTVEVYNATSGEFLYLSQGTNQTGWARFQLETGNYTFKAFWKNVEVGAMNQSVTEDFSLPFKVNLSNLKLTVLDEKGIPIPFVDLNLSYNYTTRANKTISEAGSFTTNINGIVQIQSTFTNISYLIEARRYGFLFNTTFIASLPVQAWNNITVIAPTYTLNIRLLDSKNAPATGLRVVAYEWSSGTAQPTQTRVSVDGNVTFSLAFGKYRLRAFDDSLVLSETTIDLIEDNLNFTFHLTTFNVDVTVWVRDFFGQPIANADVTIEHKIGEEYVFAYSQVTGSDGSATFASKVGGDSRISVYVRGRLAAVQTQFLGISSSDVPFKVGEYVAILGYPIESGLFALLSFIIVLAVASLVLMRGRLLKVFGKKRKR